MFSLFQADQPKKLSESKEVALWQERISIAKKAQEAWADKSGAKKYINEYKGDYGIVFQARNRKVPIPPINEVFAYVQSDLATTYNRDPYITVNAKAGTPRGAAFWEVILNYYWRELGTKDEIEFEIIDKDLVGYSWHKVGYTIESLGKGDQLQIASERLYSEYLQWKDVLWNVGSRRPPKDCMWMAQRIVLPLDEIKKRYPAAKGMEGAPSPEVDEDVFKKSPYKDDIKVGILWEIWDAQNRKKLLIGEGIKDRYLDAPMDWPDYLKEFPFLMYWDFAVPGSERPMSAIASWEPQILAEMVLMGIMLNHAKSWNRQLFIKGGSVDDNALDKFERGDDGAIITVNGNLDDASFKFADFGQLPQDFYLIIDRLQAIKRKINGQPEFVQGGVTKTGTRTVGELNMIQQGAKGRQDRKIDRLETHCENIARHMLMHLKANFDFDQAVRITGDTPDNIIQALGENYDPITKTVKFTTEDIQGEYGVDVKSGSTLPMDKATKQQMLEIILNTLGPVAGQATQSSFIMALVQELLRDYDIKSLEEAYDQDIQQAQQAQAQQQGQQSVQDQKTEAETAKRSAQAQQIGVETEITAQEAQMGPIARAQLERLKKPEPKVPAGAK